MEPSLPTKGKAFPPAAERVRAIASFRITYVAVFAFALLYVFSVRAAERLLQAHFQSAVARAVQVEATDGSAVAEIRRRVREVVNGSAWVRPGGVRVTTIVLARDGSPIFAGDLPVPVLDELDPASRAHEAERVLPVSTDVTVAVPHNSLVANGILVLYGSILLLGLYAYQRGLAQRQEALLVDAVAARDAAASRAGEIERELTGVRSRLREVDSAEGEHAREIDGLRSERAALLEKLEAVERREQELSTKVSGAGELDEERRALEELLDEALVDLRQKDGEITELETRLKRASKDAASAAGARTREAEMLGRRVRTLYKNLEVDERAVEDMVDLRDETMKLKAEEALKRLSDDVETAGARRKVGGLPPGLPVFELGFAGKGRIYYTHGAQRRSRILCIGAKNTQNADLEYLSKVVRTG